MSHKAVPICLPAIIKARPKTPVIGVFSPSDRSFVNFIHRIIAARGCSTAIVENRIVGYGILEYKFFYYGFFSMVHVHPEFSCHGVAKAIILHMEQACKTSKIFTSTHAQDKHMQNLLTTLDYQPSGAIENLDSELTGHVYFKQLNKTIPK